MTTRDAKRAVEHGVEIVWVSTTAVVSSTRRRPRRRAARDRRRGGGRGRHHHRRRLHAGHDVIKARPAVRRSLRSAAPRLWGLAAAGREESPTRSASCVKNCASRWRLCGQDERENSGPISSSGWIDLCAQIGKSLILAALVCLPSGSGSARAGSSAKDGGGSRPPRLRSAL